MGSEQFPAVVSRDAMAEHYAYLAERQNKPKEPVQQNGLVEDFLRSTGHAMIQTPVNALVQMTDKAVGTNLLPKVQIDALKVQHSEYGTGNYWAQQTGAAVGMLVPFLAVGKGVKSVTRAGMTEAQLATALTQRSVLGLTMKEAVLTGVVHDSVLRPVEQNDHRPYLVAKGLNGFQGGVNMALLHSIGKAFTPAAAAESSQLTKLVKNPYMGGIVSGGVTGAATAPMHSYLHNLKFDSVDSFANSAWKDAKGASWREVKESAVTMGVIGLGFGTAHGMLGKFESGRKNFEWQKQNGDTVNGAEGKSYKAVGGERAVTQALKTLDETGTARLTVREHLGEGKGIKRFLGMQEFGPKKELQIDHNRTNRPLIPENQRTADLLATCFLDPSMQGKSVLGASSITEGPLFMRSGKNRLNFSPTEQEINKGETAPRRLGAGEGYNLDKLAIREGLEWTAAEKAKLHEGEWTPAMVAKLETVNQYLKREGGTEAETYRDALSDTRLSKFKVARFLDRGNDAYVVELPPQEGLPNGGALKLVNNYEGGWNESWGKRPYDAEILLGGKHWELTDSSGRDVIAYVQELVTRNFDESMLPAFERKLEKAGVTIRDPGTEGGFQYGLSLNRGKLVLIDYEAVDKNPTLENLIAGRNTEEIERIEREREMEENAEPAWENVQDVDVMRNRSEAYPKGSVKANMLQDLIDGQRLEDVAIWYVEAEARKVSDPGKLDWDALQKRGVIAAREVQKDARQRGLLGR